MNASRNHTLTLIGPAVTDHDNALMSEVATKQDLYNVGVLIDSNFKSLAGDIHNLRTDMDAQFVRVDSQFVAVRSEMATGFATVASEFVAVRSEMRSLFTTFQDDINKRMMRTGFATFLAIVALFGIDRWWS
ncbi:MAG: hypothetical protein RJB41_1250 [Actinomycetota bacterium]